MLATLTSDEALIVVRLYFKVPGGATVTALMTMESRIMRLVLHANTTVVIVGKGLPRVSKDVDAGHVLTLIGSTSLSSLYVTT